MNELLVHLHKMSNDDLHKLATNCCTIVAIKTGSKLSWDDKELSLEKLVRMALEIMCEVE